MSNVHIGSTNSHYNQVCAVPYPQDKHNWICSRSHGHRGDHKAYWGHETASRSRFYDSWPNTAKAGSASKDDVAEALASIQATMTKRLPPEVVAARISETNNALAEKFDGTGVSVQIHVQTPLRAELDEIIDRLILLRDSLP